MKKPARKNRYARKPSEGAVEGRFVRSRLIPGILSAVSGVIVLSAMGLMCIFGYDWVTQCGYFRAGEITIAGNERLDPEKIRSIAGLEKGVNIFSVNLSAARKQLLAEPWIREAGIRRELPSGISIQVVEHEALAVIDFGRLFLIDACGGIFKVHESGDAPLPVISGIAYNAWVTGQARDAGIYRAVMEILRLGGDQNSIIPNSNIERIIVDKEIGLSLQIREPMVRVALGFGEYEKKIGRFAKISDHLARTEQEGVFAHVDIQNPDRVVARPVSQNQVVAGKGGSSEGT